MYEITLKNAITDDTYKIKGTTITKLVANIIFWMDERNGTKWNDVCDSDADGLCVYLDCKPYNENGHPYVVLQWDELNCGWEVRIEHDVHDEFETWAAARDFFLEHALVAASKVRGVVKFTSRLSVHVPVQVGYHSAKAAVSGAKSILESQEA